MKTMRLFLVFLVMCGFFFATTSHAAYIVDTGEPIFTQTYHADFLIIPGQDTYLYAQFTLDTPHYINSIQGYAQFGDNPAELNVSIYTADKINPLPNVDMVPGILLFNGSGSFFSDRYWAPDELILWDWAGPTGLNEYLEAGTYWIYFYSNDYVYMGSRSGAPVPNRLVEVFSDAQPQPSTAWWYETLNLGVRIEGVQAQVPVPGTLFLMGPGLVGLAGMRRKVRKS